MSTGLILSLQNDMIECVFKQTLKRRQRIIIALYRRHNKSFEPRRASSLSSYGLISSHEERGRNCRNGIYLSSDHRLYRASSLGCNETNHPCSCKLLPGRPGALQEQRCLDMAFSTIHWHRSTPRKDYKRKYLHQRTRQEYSIRSARRCGL